MSEHPGVWFAIGALAVSAIGAAVIIALDYIAERKMKAERRKDLRRRGVVS